MNDWTDEVVFIIKLMALILLASIFSFLVFGCGTPPRKVYRYEVAFYYEVNGQRYEVRDWGYGEPTD